MTFRFSLAKSRTPEKEQHACRPLRNLELSRGSGLVPNFKGERQARCSFSESLIWLN